MFKGLVRVSLLWEKLANYQTMLPCCISNKFQLRKKKRKKKEKKPHTSTVDLWVKSKSCNTWERWLVLLDICAVVHRYQEWSNLSQWPGEESGGINCLLSFLFLWLLYFCFPCLFVVIFATTSLLLMKVTTINANNSQHSPG